MKKPWLEHSSKWVPENRPEHNFKLDVPKDVKNLPIEVLYSTIGVSLAVVVLLALFSTALV